MSASSNFPLIAVIGVAVILLAAPQHASSSEDQSSSSSSSTDHCFRNLYENLGNSSHMQFTKEVVSKDYAVLGSFKSLHCCSKGYRSIEWMKDGKPYPWKSDISSLIVYPEASNQTIYTRQVQVSDIGNYTCVLRNDTHKITHHMTLNIQGNLPDLPLATYHPRDQQVEFGAPARFYCEAFIGKVGLPDMKSEISWYQVKDGLEEVEGEQIQNLRENGQNIGSYLKILQVREYNYGRYLCRVEFNNAAHRLEMYATLSKRPSMSEMEREFALYQTIAAVISAIVAAIVVLGLWCLLRPWWLRRNGAGCKNQCQATSASNSSSSRGRENLSAEPRNV